MKNGNKIKKNGAKIMKMAPDHKIGSRPSCLTVNSRPGLVSIVDPVAEHKDEEHGGKDEERRVVNLVRYLLAECELK
jgi:hypothetical protein